MEAERRRENVLAHVSKEGLDWPHLVDNDYRYWRALDNNYWPSVYLVDRCGRLRALFIGEIHGGQPSGTRADAQIEVLLAETTEDCSHGS